MSKQSTEALIAEARKLPEEFKSAQLPESAYLEDDALTVLDAVGYGAVHTARRLADALEAAEKRAEEAEADLDVELDKNAGYREKNDQLATALEAATVRPMFRCEADLTCTREAQKPRCGPSDLIVCPTHRQELLEAAEQRAEDAEGEMEGMVDLDSEFIHRLETQRDRLAAVVEKVREEVEAADGVDVTSQNLIPVLATAPQEVLRERDAALIEGLADELDGREEEPSNPYSYDPWEDDSVDPTNLDEVVDAAVDEGWATGEYRGRRDAVLAIREKARQKREE